MKKITLLLSTLALLHAEPTMVKDDSTKLLWEDTPHVELTKVNHNQAKQYCEELTIEKYENWRLPTLQELLTIVDYKRYKPALLKEFSYVDDETLYWSNTPYVRSSDEYWGVSFKDGSTSNASINYDRYVRCVHDIQ
ncbi:MAG: DUF1566 domain-containing protein [Campylobacterales bacterium]|nr:DUF1566 domain-containing protein [Campylobacterales bacterium]